MKFIVNLTKSYHIDSEVVIKEALKRGYSSSDLSDEVLVSISEDIALETVYDEDKDELIGSYSIQTEVIE